MLLIFVHEIRKFFKSRKGFEQTSSFDRFSVMFDKNAPYKKYKCQNFVKIVNVSAADLDDEELGGPLRTQARNDKEQQSCWKDRETEVRSLINRPEVIMYVYFIEPPNSHTPNSHTYPNSHTLFGLTKM